MKRIVYIALAIVAAVIVWFTNDAISAFLQDRSLLGSGLLFVILPLAALLTRPMVVGVQRNREQRAIGLVYAFRTRSYKFIFKSIGLWILWTLLILALIFVLYREGEIAIAAALSNWWYVVNLLALIAHLVPGRFQLKAADPTTILVLGGPESGKSTFIGLLPLDRSNAEFSFNAMPSTSRLTAQLHARARGAGAIQPINEIPRSTLVARRPWSMYTGVRPLPVDFIELQHYDPARRLMQRTAIAICIPADTSDEAIRRELQKHMHALRGAGLADAKGHIRLPVAVLLSKSDLGTRDTLPKSAIELLDQNCKTWETFALTDRKGATPFTPSGYLDAALWLVRSAG